MKHGRIIDAEFVMIDQADQPGPTRKKPTIGQLWYLFCYGLLMLAFLAVALPLFIGSMYLLSIFFRTIF